MNLKVIIERALAFRAPLLSDSDEQVIRLINGAPDGAEGLTADLYGEFIMLQFYKPCESEALKEYAAVLSEALAAAGMAVAGVLAKDRTLPGARSESPADAGSRESFLLSGSPPSSELIVKHNGVLASVDLLKGQNTGLFHDMRDVRNQLKTFIEPGGTLLNLFCYTGMFSVFYMKNGGGSARNIDIAGSVLKRAQQNYGLNSLTADSRDFVKEDSLKWIRYAEKKGLRFSMAVFDPPSFARSKKGHFSVRRDYLSSLEILGNICPGGSVLTAVNSHSVPLEEYMEMHPRGWKNLFLAHEASDFRNDGRPYLKTGLWRVPA